MTEPRGTKAGADTGEPPVWLAPLLAWLEARPPLPDGGPVAAALAADPVEVREVIAQIGRSGGLGAVHAFVDAVLEDPVGFVLRTQKSLGKRLTQRRRDQIEGAALATALAIAGHARMRSRWEAVLRLCSERGETDLAQVAALLGRIADPRESGRKLIRRLRNRDPEVRELAAYLLAEYAAEPFFGEWRPRLAERAADESVDFVRAAYARLLKPD